MSTEQQPASSSFGGLKDFSVDAQRRMFIEQQERERQEAENKKESRKIKKATAGATGVELSGLMSNLENNKANYINDDDDDSIGNNDDWSVNSEESFYVGIDRADYAQPDNLEMYGEEEKDEYEIKEDRFGISRVSVAIINRTFTMEESGKSDWDADIPIHDEKSSSLYDFMNGTDGSSGTSNKNGAGSKKDIVVAKPLIGSSLEWNEENKLGEDDAALDQVYQHKAAEGKMFIDKLVGTPSSKGGARTAPSSIGTLLPGTPGGNGGNYPTLSPMALFSPGITTPGTNKIVEGEDNGVRQMRERELRKDASAGASQKMKDLKKMIATTKDKSGKVDAFVLMKQLEKMMAE